MSNKLESITFCAISKPVPLIACSSFSDPSSFFGYVIWSFLPLVSMFSSYFDLVCEIATLWEYTDMYLKGACEVARISVRLYVNLRV